MVATIQRFARGFGVSARDGRVLEVDGVVASAAPAIGFRSLFNAAAYTSVPALAAAVPKLQQAYDELGITAWGVWAHKSDAEAAGVLSAADLQLDSTPTAMAADIADIDVARADVTVERTHDLEAFDRVLAAAYGFPPGVIVYCFPKLLDSFRGYLARDAAGEPVATVGTVDCDGDCGINLVATVPPARGHGYASALMAYAVADGARRGCTSTTLQATAMARSLYARLGYRDFGTMQLWERRRETPAG